MKKTEISYRLTSGEEVCSTLYGDIPQLYGECMYTTNGDPVPFGEIEEMFQDAEEEDEFYPFICEEYNAVVHAIESTDTYWEPCTEEDEEYVVEWLKIWGIA